MLMEFIVHLMFNLLSMYNVSCMRSMKFQFSIIRGFDFKN